LRSIGWNVSPRSDPGRNDRSGSESLPDFVDRLCCSVAALGTERQLPRIRSVNKVAHRNPEEANGPIPDSGSGEETPRGVPDVGGVGDRH